MTNNSPLRYPGGKSSMVGLLRQIRRLNGLGGLSIAEPYAGGAGASLALLYLEEACEIFINDADPALHDFWWSLVNRPSDFETKLLRTRVSMTEWRRQRNIYRDSRRSSKVRRGFSAFYLNRCNRSGIILDGGPIGGIKQRGNWKLNARFNKKELIRRCQKIAEYRDRIHVSGHDGVDFLVSRDTSSTFFFIDPPYYLKGPLLYLNLLDDQYHASLAAQLREMTDSAWVLTYDDCPQVRRLYRGWATIRPFGLRYAASVRRKGKELLITPKWMRLPNSQPSLAISW